jgi:hypothetical protein
MPPQVYTAKNETPPIVRASSMHLARRWSIQNEHDLLQEDLYGTMCHTSLFFAWFLVSLICIHSIFVSFFGCVLSTKYVFIDIDTVMPPAIYVMPDPKPIVYNEKYCEALSHHMINPRALPKQCHQYQTIVTELKRRETDTTHPTQFMT